MKTAAQLRQEIDGEKAQEKRVELDTAYRSSGLFQTGPKPDQYKYDALYEEGQGFAQQEGLGIELPNKWVNKGQVLIGGYDLGTGERYTNQWKDEGGVIQRSVQELQKSSFYTDAGPPPEDEMWLAAIATQVAEEGGDAQAFRDTVPQNWQDEMVAAAWEVGSRANSQVSMRELADTYKEVDEPAPTLDENGQPVPLKLHPDELLSHPQYGPLNRAAFEEAYSLFYPGREFQGDDLQALDDFQKMMAMANFSITDLVLATGRANTDANAPDRRLAQLAAIYHLGQGAPTETMATWSGAARAAAAMAGDPANLVGLGVAGPASKAVARLGIRAGMTKLTEGFIANRLAAAGISGAVEGGVWGALDSLIWQKIESEQGLRDAYSIDEVLQSAAFTAAFGGVLGAAIGGTVSPQTAEMLKTMYYRWLYSDAPAAGGRRAQLGQAFFHGTGRSTPFHRFSTKFMGDGQGVQAFGWGLYFSENPGVAEGYRRDLGTFDIVFDGTPVSHEKISDPLVSSAVKDMQDLVSRWNVDNPDTNISDSMVRKFAELAVGDIERVDPGIAKTLKDMVDDAGTISVKHHGKLYEVDIDDKHVENFLDWNAPFTEQPVAVQKLAESMWGKLAPGRDGKIRDRLSFFNNQWVPSYIGKRMDGKAIYSEFAKRMGSPEAASRKLSELGVKGLRYYGDTIAGSKTNPQKMENAYRNIVVFDESIVDIKSIDNEPASVVLGNLAAQGPITSDSPINRQRGAVDASGRPRTVMDELDIEDRGVIVNEILDDPDFKSEQRSVKEVARVLQERAVKAQDGRVIEWGDEDAIPAMARRMAAEAEGELKRPGNAAHWYRDDMQVFHRLAEEKYPELAQDPHARMAFDVALAVTSNGQTVDQNVKYALQVYELVKARGDYTFPTGDNVGWGVEAPRMRENFETWNMGVERFGIEKFVKLLDTNFTVRELTNAGFSSSGHAADDIVAGSAIFGPKIGAAFLQNIRGNREPVTKDLWFTRFANRLRGHILQKPEKVANSLAAFRKGFTAEHAEQYGVSLAEVRADNSVAFEVAGKIYREWGKSGWDKTGPALKIRELSRTLSDNLQPVAAPGGSAERQAMDAAVKEAVRLLKSKGLVEDDFSPADFQALVWFPEKTLYAKMGSRDTRSAPTDYAKEMAAVLEGEGYDRKYLDNLSRTERQLRGASATAGRTRTSGLEPGERARWAGTESVREFRRGFADAAQGKVSSFKRLKNPGTARHVIDGEVFAVDGPVYSLGGTNLGNRFKALNWAQAKTVEVSGAPGAHLFWNALRDAKEAHPDGAQVYQYDFSEYVDMRLFVTEDGKAGFAVKPDGDIVSVFHQPGHHRGWAHYALQLAITHGGGKKLDAFDTTLPDLYTIHGFRETGRDPWSEEYAPDGWDKKRAVLETPDYDTKGEPDVVYFEHDPDYFGDYTPRAAP